MDRIRFSISTRTGEFLLTCYYICSTMMTLAASRESCKRAYRSSSWLKTEAKHKEEKRVRIRSLRQMLTSLVPVLYL